jgi:hypothetical protein
VNLHKTSSKLLVGFLFMILILTFTGSIQGSTRFFPLTKVKPGLIGYGYTVFNGTKIEKFTVKVIAVIDSSYRHDHLILVQLSGRLLEQNGGLSAGMSGSPVYFQGKLAGAVSYGFENADPFLAFMTPIETMMNLMKGTDIAKIEPLRYHNGILKPVPVTAPVLISGMGRRGYELVKQSLQEYGLTAVYSLGWGGMNNKDNFKEIIRPGSAISVQLITGDYQVAALGTVTFVDGRKFLAFGHSFTNKGTVDYLAFNAFVFHTVKSPVMSFKLAAPLHLVGRITEDRTVGILGKLGENPDLISVTANVKDSDRKQTRNFSFAIIDNEQAARDLIIAGVTDAIDQTIDRVGGGTAIVNFTIETGEQTLISRQNLFYGKDIAVDCLKDLKKVLELLTTNEYTPVRLKSIRTEVEVNSGQTTARITGLYCERTKIKPGEMFLVKAQLHTYRGVDLTIPFTVKLPEPYPPGKLNFVIRSGSKDIPNDAEAKKSELKSESLNSGSLTELLAKFTDSPKNNELILEYYPSISPKSEDINHSGNSDLLKPVKIRSLTDYYIQGEAQFVLDVEN